MWRLKNDGSKAVFTASEHVRSAHRGSGLQLPENAIVFFIGNGTEYLLEHHAAEKLPEPFPRFLGRCPIWKLDALDLCFLHGGYGAPQAADTVETLAALGVKRIISVGMCGGFDEHVRVGEIIAPRKAFVEEGTSLHYYETVPFACPDTDLLERAASFLQIRTHPIVTTDAVYRQTFRKEQLWRDQGAVGVDMETSAVFSVARYLGVSTTALLMVSDRHPLSEDAPRWEWCMTKEMKCHLVEQALSLAEQIIEH